jgi:dUTP pyrophosphatase
VAKVYMKKLHKDVHTPKFATAFSSGADVHAYIPFNENRPNEVSNVIIYPGQTVMVDTGLLMQAEKGYDIKFFPRSGLAAKLQITLTNAVGVIDRDYPKECKVLLHNLSQNIVTIYHEERIAQMLVQKVNDINFVEVEELPTLVSTRSDGFGHTGK